MTDDAPYSTSTRHSAAFTTILGVDCATKPHKVGLARAHVRDGDWYLTDTQVCSAAEPPVEVLARWIAQDPDCLLALDAPLGWPSALSAALPSHRAGQPVRGEAETLFNRATDRFVRASLGKRPLDVGADRIARTALATLELLKTLRERTAAPLLAHDVDARAYKAVDASDARLAVERLIDRRLTTERAFDAQTANDNVLDAVLCIVSGLDFIAGASSGPSDRDTAEREGWIWVRDIARDD